MNEKIFLYICIIESCKELYTLFYEKIEIIGTITKNRIILKYICKLYS